MPSDAHAPPPAENVLYWKLERRWEATLKVDGKTVHLGYFTSKKLAEEKCKEVRRRTDREERIVKPWAHSSGVFGRSGRPRSLDAPGPGDLVPCFPGRSVSGGPGRPQPSLLSLTSAMERTGAFSSVMTGGSLDFGGSVGGGGGSVASRRVNGGQGHGGGPESSVKSRGAGGGGQGGVHSGALARSLTRFPPRGSAATRSERLTSSGASTVASLALAERPHPYAVLQEKNKRDEQAWFSHYASPF